MVSIVACTTAARNVAARQHVVRRLLTSDATASAAPSTASGTSGTRRLVVSRRAWQSFRDKNLPPKPKKAPTPKEEEKPWPRSVRIGGSAAGAIFLPYTFLWVVTSNPTLRDWLGPYLPMDRLRPHFGHLEWDVQSYSDEMVKIMADQDVGKKVVPEYYQFPNEATYQVRQQQRLIDAMEGSDVKVTVHLSESDGHQVQETKIVSGRTRANEQTLIGLLKGGSNVIVDATSSTSVAVDFEDDGSTDARSLGDEGFQNASSTPKWDQLSAEDASVSVAANNKPAAPLLHEMQTFSTWYHVHTQGNQQATASKSTVTDTEVEISRLEYVLAELEKSLKDPNCTRDIDEMMAELRQAKRELSGLKWRRRLRIK